jgi:hypothetical protein
MAIHDYNLANQSGADFRADLNNALSAILSNNASATEPTTTTAYMLWVDTTNNLLKMRNSADNAWITLPVSITTSNAVDIDGGTVNTITSLSFSSGETVTTILDEDDLSSDSASALATQQSIKAYVDSQVTAQDLDFQGDTGGALSIDLDSETFTISGGNGIDTSGALNTLTIAIDSSVVTLTDTQTLTNKTIDADNNTISNLEVDNLKSGILDTDLTSVSASDDTLASSKAIKTYVDSQVTAQDLDLTDGTTSISIDLDSEELSVLGGTGVTSTASGNGVTLAIGQDVGTTADVTFNTVAADLTGDVTGTVSSLANHDTDDLAEGTNLYYTQARFDSALAAKDTGDLTEGTNLYFTDERVDDRVNNLLVAGSNVTLTYDDVANTLTIAATEDNLSNNTTDDLAEGSTNLYFTNARARAAISVSGDLAYNSTTGVLSFTERTDAEVRGLVSASGDLVYNSTTGVFSFTERTDAEVRGLISGGTGVTYNNTTGVISIGQAVGTSDNVTFGDVIVSGDLTVSGTTTTVNTETINLADNIILFNSNASGTPTENAGIEIERGDATNKTLLWNETDDKWTVGSETFVAATFEGALTGNVTGTVSSLSNHDTGDLAEGSNLYYTTARFDSAFSGKTTSDLTEGTNLYYTTARFDTAFSGKDTDDLTEGATNLYYTTARANSDFDTRLATKSTSDLSEGTNLYYTDSRFDTRLATKTTDNLTEGSTNLYYADSLVDSHLSGGTGVTYSSGTISIGQSVGTGDSVTFAGVSSDFTGDIDGAVKFTAKADVALTKGQVVYISGISGSVPTVNLADADNSSAMPAFGLVYANANQNASVEIITFGSLADFDTSGFSVGDTVYVSTTAGSLTATPPTGESSLIQNIGIVQRSHASAGIIKVGGAGRTNATPNLNSGKIFYGNGSNQSVATTLDTSIVPENTNLYYTDSRFDTRLASKSTSDLSEGTNLYYTTARFDSAFSGKDTDNLSEGSSNLYYTDERVDDRVSNLLVAGSNVTLTYNDVANTLTISATEDNLSNNDTDDLAEGATNLYFTNERVDDRVAALIQDGTGISWSYVDASGTLTPTVSLSSFSTTNLSEGTNLYYTTARFNSAFSGKSTSDLSEGTNLYYTDERVDDRVANLLTAGSNITLTYDDGAGTLTIAATEDNLSNNTTDDLAEGSTNLYFTTARARSSISATGDISYNSTTGVISFTASSAVTSVNSQTGTVVLDTDDISEGTTNLYFSNERVDDRVNALLTAGTGITLTYDDGANTLTIAGSAQYGDSDVESYLDTNGLTLPDNVKAQFGASNDLQIYHDGLHSKIQDAGTGDLKIQATNLLLEAIDGTNYIYAVDNTAVRIYHPDATNDIKLATTSTGIDVTGNIAVSGTVDGRDLATDGTKLDGIESGATADQTASEILTALLTVDGAGSGLDADTLDGISSASFLRSDVDDTLSGNLTVTGNLTVQGTTVTLDATTLNVEDKNITLNYSTGDSSGSADGAGITIQDAVNSTTDATILWDATNDKFDISHNVDVTGAIISEGGSFSSGTETATDAGFIFQKGDYIYSDDNSYLRKIIGHGGDNHIYIGQTGTALIGDIILSSGNSGNIVFNTNGTETAKFDSSGNLTLSGTVDGRDIASDGSKLDGIESGATADQTATEILTAIKTVDGAGSGLDADLLDGLSSASFLRSDAPDTAASTITFSDGIKFTNAVASLTTDLSKHIALYGTSYGFSITPSTLNLVANNTNTLSSTSSALTSKVNHDFSAGIDVTGNITVTGTVDGRDIASDGSKLDGIESGATADQSASEILTLIKTVDGSGSGLDADLFDGLGSGSFLRSDTADTATGQITFNSTPILAGTSSLEGGEITFGAPTGGGSAFAIDNYTGHARLHTLQSGKNFQIIGTNGTTTIPTGLGTIWASGNDGAGSGLDADTVDGIQAASFLRSDASDTLTGAYTFTNDTNLKIRSATNGVGAGIDFSDHAGGSYAQVGTIDFVHSDTAAYGSGAAFVIGSTEATTTILADGKLMYSEGIYSKPATGTGAGTRKDSNWDTAYGWGNHASAGYLSATGGTMTGNLTMSGANIYPATDNTGQVGNSTYTWNFGHFTNFQVDSTLTVRAYIDLADSDGIRWGSSDDYRMFYNGSTNYMNFEMEANNQGLIFTDNGTTRYTFAKAGTLSFETNGNNTNGGNIRLGSTQNNATKFTSITSREYTNDTETEGFTIIGSVATTERSVIIGGGYLEQNSANKIKFYTTSGTARTGTEVMTIDPSGKVGIATTTTTPHSGLHIAKYGTAGEDCLKVEGQVRLEGQSRTRLTITAANAASSNKMWNLDNDSGTLRIFNEDYSSAGVGTSGAVRAQLDGNGVFTVNSGYYNSGGTIRLQINGSTQMTRDTYATTFQRGADSNNYFSLDAATNCYFTFGGANAYITSNGAQIMKFLSSLVYIPSAFTNQAQATYRDVWVEDNGELGYNSSVRASKMNIEDVTDASWLYSVNPKTFYKRKIDDDGNYTEENYGIKEYGFIAEDIEEHAPELCFYNVDRESTYDENGTEIFSEEFTKTELAGIHYSQLTAPMLKLIQEQKQLIDDLTARIETLENS